MSGVKSNYWLNAIMLKQVSREQRNHLLDALNDDGIMVRPAWNLANTLPMYKSCPSDDLSVSRRIEESLINVPSSPSF
jgi:perosamine synthetase